MHMHRQRLLDSNATFLRLLREAAAEGSADAANLLGCVAPSEAEATQLFEQATRMEPPALPVAHTNAAVMHTLSLSLPRDLPRAAAHLLRAAAQGEGG